MGMTAATINDIARIAALVGLISGHQAVSPQRLFQPELVQRESILNAG